MSVQIGDDYLDSRDIQETINELNQDIENLSEDDLEQLELLQELKDDGANGEWDYGQEFIHENEWVDYVQEMLQDCGDLPQEIPWYIAIDWEETARNIAADYSLVTVNDHTYYTRIC